MVKIPPFLRYPGGKRRMLDFLSMHLPGREAILGRFIEPFVGGGAIFFYLQPQTALLSDLNAELISIYRGIKSHPERVWNLYRAFPAGKRGYNAARKLEHALLSPAQKAARALYLNRTCFKGMWRHNLLGKFNVGYGGETRRWALARKDLLAISKVLKRTTLKVADFQTIIESATAKDFLYLDPPYRPGAREQINEHYASKQFSFADQQRLSASLRSADRAGVRWVMTTSGHPDIKTLYRGFRILEIPKGTGPSPGSIVSKSGEVLVLNN